MTKYKFLGFLAVLIAQRGLRSDPSPFTVITIVIHAPSFFFPATCCVDIGHPPVIVSYRYLVDCAWKESGQSTSAPSRYKGAKGFGIATGIGGELRGMGPGNTSIGTLFADERCIPAVLSFLSSTKCGQVKEGVIVRGGGP